jgi:hypothetical protein
VLADAAEEGARLVSLAQQAGLTVRLFGGVAIRILTDSLTLQNREIGRDIDFVIRRRDRRAFADQLATEGYAADKHYNALNGHRQAYYIHPESGRPIDVVVDRLVMCHTLELADRLALSSPTLTPADLLLTKLQVVELTQKDMWDVAALLSACDIQGEGPRVVDLKRLQQVTSDNWGWWRTVTGSLTTIRNAIESGSLSADWDPILIRRIDKLQEALALAPKSARWHLRSRVGERMRWYDLPEEVDHE